MHLTLHLTDTCNLACKYCYVNQSVHNMSLEVAKAAIDMASKQPGHTGIIFFGGEPLLRRQIIYDTVHYADSMTPPNKFHFKITTNGMLLDREFLSFSQEHEIFIALSHDGVAQDVNRVTHDDCGTFDRVNNAAKELLNIRPYAPAMMTIAPNTAKFYAQGVQYLYELGFRYLICSLDYAGNWTEQDLQILKQQYEILSHWYETLTLREEKFYFSPFEVKISSHIRGKNHCAERCELGKKQISVAPDGKLYPCVQFVGREEYCIGDVFSGIDSEKQRKLYLLNEKEKIPCRDCAIKNRCNRHCACLNMQSTGNLRTVSPVLCANERMLLPLVDRLAERLFKNRSGAFIQKQYNDMYPVISYIDDHI